MLPLAFVGTPSFPNLAIAASHFTSLMDTAIRENNSANSFGAILFVGPNFA